MKDNAKRVALTTLVLATMPILCQDFSAQQPVAVVPVGDASSSAQPLLPQQPSPVSGQQPVDGALPVSAPSGQVLPGQPSQQELAPATPDSKVATDGTLSQSLPVQPAEQSVTPALAVEEAPKNAVPAEAVSPVVAPMMVDAPVQPDTSMQTEPAVVVPDQALQMSIQEPIVSSGQKIEEPSPVTTASLKIEQQEDFGLTTTSEDRRGNWYYKRQYLKEAGGVYKEIRQVVALLDGIKKDIFAKRADLDRQLADFYLSLGFQQGELEELLNETIQALEKERSVEGQLNEKERGMLVELSEKKKLLEDTRKDIEAIKKLDAALDQAYKTLLEQVERSNAADQKSWELHDAIAEVLNDRKAQQLLNEMKANLELVKSVSSYLRTQLKSFVDENIDLLNQKIVKIKSDLSQLKERGVLLQKKAEQEIIAEELKAREQKEVREKKAVQEPGFFAAVLDNASYSVAVVWGWITAPFSYIANWFGGSAQKNAKESAKKI